MDAAGRLVMADARVSPPRTPARCKIFAAIFSRITLRSALAIRIADGHDASVMAGNKCGCFVFIGDALLPQSLVGCALRVREFILRGG